MTDERDCHVASLLAMTKEEDRDDPCFVIARNVSDVAILLNIDESKIASSFHSSQ
jgi:hypothetical protein